MKENEKIIYLLRINPHPEGTLEIDGERFRVYEEIDPEYENIYRQNNITAGFLDSFVKKYKQTKAEGKQPDRNLQIINTLEEKIE